MCGLGRVHHRNDLLLHCGCHRWVRVSLACPAKRAILSSCLRDFGWIVCLHSYFTFVFLFVASFWMTIISNAYDHSVGCSDGDPYGYCECSDKLAVRPIAPATPFAYGTQGTVRTPPLLPPRSPPPPRNWPCPQGMFVAVGIGALIDTIAFVTAGVASICASLGGCAARDEALGRQGSAQQTSSVAQGTELASVPPAVTVSVAMPAVAVATCVAPPSAVPAASSVGKV